MYHYTVWGTRKSKQFVGTGAMGCALDLQHLSAEISACFLLLPPVALCQHHLRRRKDPWGGPGVKTVPK